LTQILYAWLTFVAKTEKKYRHNMTVRLKMNSTNMIGVAQVEETSQRDIKPVYLEAMALVERLHRRLLDVIKDEFDRQGRSDINAVQALLLYNLGDSELTAGELRTRGYYLGSNVSYNLKKLVDMDYIHHQRSRSDRRSVRVSLTDQGKEVAKAVDALYERHTKSLEQIGQIDPQGFEQLNQSLQRLERFWTDQILYRL